MTEQHQQLVSDIKSGEIPADKLSDTELAHVISYAYNHLDAELIFALLSDDCVFESQTVLTPLKGKREIEEYLGPFFTNVRKANLPIRARAAKVVKGPVFGAIGKFCAVIEQGSQKAVVLITRSETDSLIQRLDTCIHPSPADTEPV